MDVHNWIELMQSRPNKNARQRRLFDALDSALPDWENISQATDFEQRSTIRGTPTQLIE